MSLGTLPVASTSDSSQAVPASSQVRSSSCYDLDTTCDGYWASQPGSSLSLSFTSGLLSLSSSWSELSFQGTSSATGLDSSDGLAEYEWTFTSGESHDTRPCSLAAPCGSTPLESRLENSCDDPGAVQDSDVGVSVSHSVCVEPLTLPADAEFVQRVFMDAQKDSIVDVLQRLGNDVRYVATPKHGGQFSTLLDVLIIHLADRLPARADTDGVCNDICDRVEAAAGAAVEIRGALQRRVHSYIREGTISHPTANRLLRMCGVAPIEPPKTYVRPSRRPPRPWDGPSTIPIHVVVVQDPSRPNAKGPSLSSLFQ